MLNVANTAFVDNVFPSATPVVEDAANPFATIADALNAITVARGAATTIPWRVVVRPGTYPEAAAGNVVTTLPNVDIIGSGSSTIVNATFVNNVGAGPATLSSMVVNVPSTANVTVQDTLTVTDSTWFFTPASSSVGDAFRLGGAGTPSLTMTDCFLSVVGAVPTTVGTGFYMISGMLGPSATLIVSNVRGVQNGIAAGVIGFDSISGVVTVAISNSSFDLTIQDAGAGREMFIYGGLGVIGRGNALDIVWSVDDCDHTLRDGVPGATPAATTVIAVLDGFAFSPLPTSQFILRDSLFHYVEYPVGAALFTANDTVTAGGFIQFLDDKWTGLNLSALAPTSYVPQAVPGSSRIAYDAISQAGSMVSSGGLPTGVTTVSSALAVYTVVDQDAIITWAPIAAATLTMTSSNVFVGKWLSVYNANVAGGPTITVSSGGPANGAVVAGGKATLFQTYDGINWFVAACCGGTPGQVQQSSTAIGALAVGLTATALVMAPAGTTFSGGGFTFTVATPSAVWSTVVDGPVGNPATTWQATIQNTGTVIITNAVLTVSAIAN